MLILAKKHQVLHILKIERQYESFNCSLKVHML